MRIREMMRDTFDTLVVNDKQVAMHMVCWWLVMAYAVNSAINIYLEMR